MTEKRTVSLSSEQTRYLDDLVSSGRFVSASEAVRAGLQALQERDEAIDRWLREEVVPVAVMITEHPERGIPFDEAFEDIRRRHEARMAGAAE